VQVTGNDDPMPIFKLEIVSGQLHTVHYTSPSFLRYDGENSS